MIEIKTKKQQEVLMITILQGKKIRMEFRPVSLRERKAADD